MTKGWADGHIKDPGPKMKIIKKMGNVHSTPCWQLFMETHHALH